MKERIQDAANRWADAVGTRVPENVLKAYHTDSGLWGTFSGKYMHGHEEIKEYFIELSQKENLKCEFITGYVRQFQEFAFFSGSYEFSWTESGNSIHKPARFSFVYKKESDQWLIIEHHSSLFP